MSLKLKGRIVGVAVLAALLPLLAALGTILFERAKVDEHIYNELVHLGQDNLSRISLDVYGMCKAVDATIANQGEAEDLDPEQLQALRQEIMNVKIGEDGYVYVLKGSGEDRGSYIVSLDGKSDGVNIWDSTDDNGKKFIQNIVRQALALNEGQTVIEEYSWKNAGEVNARKTRCDHLLRTLGLGHRREQLRGRISRGRKRGGEHHQ